MRILLLSNLYPPHVEGGAEILAERIAAGLGDRGHEVIVVTSSKGRGQGQAQSLLYTRLPFSIRNIVRGRGQGQAQSLHRENVQVWRMLDYLPTVHFDWKGSLWAQCIKPFRFYRRYHNTGNARTLREVIEATSPDILYVWEITGIGVNSILKVLHELHIPIVFHVGSYWFLYARSPETEQSRLRMRWLKRLLVGTVPELKWTSMIAVSNMVKQEYVRAGIDPERIEVIYNGVDPRFLTFPRAACDEDKICHLLFVGRMRAEKGILIMLKALNLLVHDLKGTGKVNESSSTVSEDKPQDSEMLPLCFAQGFSLRAQHGNEAPMRVHIVGEGEQAYVSELKAYLKEHRLEELVVFHGKVLQDELITYYDCSQIMLVPSIWQEPFGLVVIEAMARGLPVIASNVGGLPEIITHEQNGLLVKCGDEYALAQAIRELMRDTEKRQRLGEAGRATVQERFLMGETVSRVEEHLKRVWGRWQA